MSDSLLPGRRVLVVEDEMFVAMLLEDMLAEFGCEVIGPAAGVEQALKMLETAGVLDAAVLDVNLDGEKSYPVADELAARGVPFVFSTGYGKESLHNGYGSVGLLEKPFSSHEVGDALTGLLTPKQSGCSAE